MHWPRCAHCGLPSVCYGADLGHPLHRCPHCCRRMAIAHHHGPEDYLEGHAAAEGVELPSGA